MMLRGLTITGMLIFATLEPALEQVDLVKYAVTQGGLLAVVLVLLFWGRQEFRRKIEDEKERRHEAEQRSLTLMALVAQSNTAMQKTASACEAQEKATHRLARAVELLDERRGAQRNN